VSNTSTSELSSEPPISEDNVITPQTELGPHPTPRWWQRTRTKSIALLLLLYLAYSGWQLWDIHRFGHSDDGSTADCAIVLGAAAWHNKPSPVFEARIDHAIKLYKQGRVNKLILTGGHGKGAQYAESEVAQSYCHQQGIPLQDLIIETQSNTTSQNFAEAKKLMRLQKLNNALIVSDPWHLKRAQSLANLRGLQAKPSATETSRYQSIGSKLSFLLREYLYLHMHYISGV